LRPSAAGGVQFVDRDLQAARDGFAGARRLARKRGHEADLDGFLCQGRQCRQHSNNYQKIFDHEKPP
jgi:hypothetical protein